MSHLLAAVALACLAGAPGRRTPDRATPNIIVILADDFGVGDIQAHYPDHKIPTPALDRLVQEGVSFVDAHSPSAVCSPTRYGILTGRYAWRTRLQEWVLGAYEPPLIAADRPTLPGFLGDHGFDTVCVGKWHLGWDWPGPRGARMTEPRNAQALLDWDYSGPIPGGPLDRGFQSFFGMESPILPPFTYLRDRRVTPAPEARYVFDPTEGVNLPQQFEGAPMAPGWRFQRILGDLTREAVRTVHEKAQADRPFFLFFSMTSPHEPVAPSAAFRDRSGIAPIADFVMETDWAVGEVVDAVDQAGIADRTLILFTADNGHSHYTGWSQLEEAGHAPSGPYRGHKGDVWEGGHRVPLVARWPGRVAEGAVCQDLVSLTDLFATCAELLEAPLPTVGAEDSISFLGALLGRPRRAARSSLVNHSRDGEFAYRKGPWKLVYRMAAGTLVESRGLPTVPELYQLALDVAEERDRAGEEPGLVQQLTGELEAVIRAGCSRPCDGARNDTAVEFRSTQGQRWAPPAPDPPDGRHP